MSGNYVHKLFLGGEYENWPIHRVERYHTRQSRLQLVHVPRTLSSHSEQSITMAVTKLYKTTGLEIISRESYDLMKYHHKTYIMSMMQVCIIKNSLPCVFTIQNQQVKQTKCHTVAQLG